MNTSEKDFYQRFADWEVDLFLEAHGRVRGRITFVNDFSVGFIPAEDDQQVPRLAAPILEQLGMVATKESLVMKGVIRAVTPVRRLSRYHGKGKKHGGKQSGSGVAGLQHVPEGDAGVRVKPG